ncbi:MAG TPA: helix-hairpin-helix domain-containing protein [Vicinamibacterales bacterium]|nr:helix-hairpin-helix domain-containing protein [Vicinamibacterales bacterium]
MKMRFLAAVAAAMVVVGASLAAQVGKSQGVIDANTATEAQLAEMPHMTPARAQALVAARPFASILDLNKFLLSQGLTQDQANAFYARAFVHINLNTASQQEILLVPGAGKRMAHEFDEYRPWRSYAQFNKEIGKYVSADAVARLAQYTFIPMNANKASDADLLTIPGANQALVDRIKAGRPYKTAADIEGALAKGSTTPAEAKRVARFLTVE